MIARIAGAHRDEENCTNSRVTLKDKCDPYAYRCLLFSFESRWIIYVLAACSPRVLFCDLQKKKPEDWTQQTLSFDKAGEGERVSTREREREKYKHRLERISINHSFAN